MSDPSAPSPSTPVATNAHAALVPPQLPWSDKVVLITGGSGGMGRAIAQRFLDQGAKVREGCRDCFPDACTEERQAGSRDWRAQLSPIHPL